MSEGKVKETDDECRKLQDISFRALGSVRETFLMNLTLNFATCQLVVTVYRLFMNW